MRASIVCCLGLLIGTAFPAFGGKNVNGALVVHTSDTVQYTAGGAYCGPLFDDPGSCELAGTRTDRAAGEPAVIWILAAFQPDATPGVSVVYFGIEHALGSGGFEGWDMCGPAGSIEIPDDGWPETGFGNSVAFGTPVTGDTFFPLYWFAASGDPGSSLATAANPQGGYAAFVDDSNPPVLDVIEQFGFVRWQEDGANDCPVALPLGACCLGDGTCLVVDALTCDEYGGNYQGDLVPCEPNPCPQPRGGCCFDDGHCEIMTLPDCGRFAGMFLGDGTVCDPSPCAQPGQACCFISGDCSFVTEDICRLAGGTPQGPGTRCDQISCRAPQLGACCLPEAECLVLAESQCLALGGDFYDGVPCEPLPCFTPVEPTSWGRIRASFR